MVCPRPECTGKHSTRTPVAERCPAGTERIKRASHKYNRTRRPVIEAQKRRIVELLNELNGYHIRTRERAKAGQPEHFVPGIRYGFARDYRGNLIVVPMYHEGAKPAPTIGVRRVTSWLEAA